MRKVICHDQEGWHYPGCQRRFMRGCRFRSNLWSIRRHPGAREEKNLCMYPARVVWYWWPTVLTLISFVKGNKLPSPTNKPETVKPATEKPTQKVTPKPTEKPTKTPKPTKPSGETPSGTKKIICSEANHDLLSQFVDLLERIKSILQIIIYSIIYFILLARTFNICLVLVTKPVAFLYYYQVFRRLA